MRRPNPDTFPGRASVAPTPRQACSATLDQPRPATRGRFADLQVRLKAALAVPFCERVPSGWQCHAELEQSACGEAGPRALKNSSKLVEIRPCNSNGPGDMFAQRLDMAGVGRGTAVGEFSGTETRKQS